MTEELRRTVFSTSRAVEFLERRALQAQTGRPVHRFGDVVVKELLDNSLDAAETAGPAPEITVSSAVDGDIQWITVTDNGPGLPAEVIDRVLDFNVLVSDKNAYRSPSRGQQGNALKTVVGIPYALGVSDPVVIEARGVRHEIAVALDPGGNVVVEHDTSDSATTTGTTVSVPLPASTALDPGRWTQEFALLNPHATFSYLAHRDGHTDPEIYKSTAQTGWRKPVPTDKTSPHWYDAAALRRLVFAHIGHARGGGQDMPLGEFLGSFDGLSSSGKQKKIRAAVPGVRYLSDFADDPDAVGRLLAAMQTAARVPKAHELGAVPEEHYQQRLDEAFGVERFWFRRKRLLVAGVPWLLECAVAETDAEGSVTWAINYAPSYDDPFSRTRLVTADVTATGAGTLLYNSDAYPDYHNDERRAVVVHVVCPALEFVEKSKTALTVPAEVADAFAAIAAAATKDLRAEKKRAEKDRRAEVNRQTQRRRPGPKVSLKDAVAAVMAAAIEEASSNADHVPFTMPFGTRNLLYSVRPRIQRLTDAELKMGYFGQTLVVDYEREHGPIPGHYRDPRGELREPHTGKVVRLGTREVGAYELPDHVYDKILYVEKEGLNPIFAAARIAERYDLAIASGKGQPVEAVRDLFERAEAGEYRLFVVHDADPWGYSIARTISEETARMPGYQVDVIDLGLTVGQAVELGLPTERFTRKVELPEWMPERLDEQETEWFTGRLLTPPGEKKQWECTRVELNALGAAGTISLIEAGLEANGATTKVIPPDDVIHIEAQQRHETMLREQLDDVINEVFDLDTIVATLVEETAETTADRADIESHLFDDNGRPTTLSWRTAVTTTLDDRLSDSRGDIRRRIRALLAEQGIGGSH